MIRLAANISLLWPELSLPERVRAAARAGFPGIEMQWPYAWDVPEIARVAEGEGLEVVLINAPGGDLAAGDLGIAGLPGRRAEFNRSIETAAGAAALLGAGRIHVLSGKGGDRDVLVENLRWAADRLPGLTVMLEPLHPRMAPGYLLGPLESAASIVAEIGRPNVKIQFDFYHQQIMGGDLLTRFAAHQAVVGHVQIGGVPDRQEPDIGELNPVGLIEGIAAFGYDGWVGCEYAPAGDTDAGLRWAAPFGIKARAA